MNEDKDKARRESHEEPKPENDPRRKDLDEGEPIQRKQPPTAGTVESNPANISSDPPIQLEYESWPPSHPASEAPPEPRTFVPIIPPGPFKEDLEDTPPIDVSQSDSEPPLDTPHRTA